MVALAAKFKQGFYYGIILAMIGLCVKLGFWQLQRADEKKQLQHQRQQLANKKPMRLTQQAKPLQYQTAQVVGHYIQPTFYLDNQHYRHRFGYDIISPFVSQDGVLILVNRGWVPGDISRKFLPDVTTSQKRIALSGYVYYPQNPTWQLGPLLEKKSSNAYLLEQVNIDQVESLLPGRIARYTLRLRPDLAQPFVRAWPIVSMPPGRHVGYAIQWFVMAVALTLMFGYFLKKQYDKKSI